MGMTDDTIAFFSGLAAETWARAKSPEDSAGEAAYLLSRLGAKAPAQLLDVPCGDGRLARVVAAHGHRVTGIDGAADMLARATADARCEWLLGEMTDLARPLAGRPPFDGAFCFGNAVGYQPRAQTAAFLADVAAWLRPRARFVIETEMTAESVLPNFADRLWQQVGDILMVVEHRYDPAGSRLDSDYRFLRDGAVERRRLVHHIFSSGELVGMLEAAGFDVVALESDLDGTPFTLGDPRLLLTAVRRGKAKRR